MRVEHAFKRIPPCRTRFPPPSPPLFPVKSLSIDMKSRIRKGGHAIPHAGRNEQVWRRVWVEIVASRLPTPCHAMSPHTATCICASNKETAPNPQPRALQTGPSNQQHPETPGNPASLATRCCLMSLSLHVFDPLQHRFLKAFNLRKPQPISNPGHQPLGVNEGRCEVIHALGLCTA